MALTGRKHRHLVLVLVSVLPGVSQATLHEFLGLGSRLVLAAQLLLRMTPGFCPYRPDWASARTCVWLALPWRSWWHCRYTLILFPAVHLRFLDSGYHTACAVGSSQVGSTAYLQTLLPSVFSTKGKLETPGPQNQIEPWITHEC